MSENYDTILVSISSKDCSTGSGSSDGCTFDVTNNCLQNVESFRVKDVSVPKTFYNVEATNARKWDLVLYFIGNVSGAFSITIPQGIYTIALLQAAIAAQFLAVVATTVVVTVDAVTQRLVITRTAGTNLTLQINPAGAGANVYGLNRLGFYTQVALNATITADTGYVLVLTQSILLQSSHLGSYRNMCSGFRPGPAMSPAINKSNVIYRAYLNQVNSQDYVTCVIPSTYYQLFDYSITKLDFQITDDQGNAIDLRNQTWSCTLEFLIKKAGA